MALQIPNNMIRSLIRIVVLPMVILIITVGFKVREDATTDQDDLSAYKVTENDVCFNVPTLEEQRFFDYDMFSPFLGYSYLGFREALAFKESQGRYTVVNQFGYMGKYQFGKATLRMIGVYDASDYLQSPEVQEEAFAVYTSRNKWVLRRDINRFVGRTINGVKVTESGILAAAHLAGPGNVKKYLRSGGTVGFNDAFGTSIRYYMRKFAGYDTSGVIADKTAKVERI
ncbi:peptidoglycan-binding protein LysM [Gilvibacter sp.]|uniref:peptidoglycan-binding protein LysM n=1 Tax=Gilvibacter sp. TaxID=2729997 RepID=UPI003F4A7334